MKIRLVFDAQFCGRMEKVVDIQEDCADIPSLFEEFLGVRYDENCTYEVIDE